ncbi:MAG: ribA/ribD-fused uncharacterized protein [Crocinitomix sp.]|jgi:ribA/ribD-fused uncharacterized protein
MPFNFTIDKPMPPLWIMYPEITQFSIGWRMGYGEGYKWDLFDWLKKLTVDDKKRYDEMFPRPAFWRNPKDANFDEYSYELISFWKMEGKPKYSIGNLATVSETSEYLHFWKPKHEIVDKACLSQWQYSKFEVDIYDYTSAEQYMMAEKARLFEDEEIEKKIMNSNSPKEIKSLGQKVRNFKQDIWDKVKYSIVLTGNYYKFSQNKEMRDFLLSTDNKILVEASPLDKIWGVGLSAENSKINTPHFWNGKNLLGFALMELRDDLQKVYKNVDIIDWEHLKKYRINQ